MRNWILVAALGAAAMTSAGASGATPQDSAPPPPPVDAPAPPPRGGPLLRADADGDGIVTRDEVVADADRRFAAMDADHNGKIDKDERRAFHERERAMRPAPRADRPAPPPPGMAGGDENRPPRRPRDETQAQFREQATRMFDRIDTNHDGRVDPQEREAMALLTRARRAGEQGDHPKPPAPPAPAR